jgi:hypothetical protein
MPVGIEVPEIHPWPYLTHWTRRCYGPWPGEKAADFYRHLAQSGDEYPRSARATLGRILEELRIRSSSERIRGGEVVVAFTALSPAEALPLMKWRPRYVRPTFEPYGICIHRKAAQTAGIQPVEYLPHEIKSHATPRALQQGFGRGLWPVEAEWRALGDVDLSKIDPEMVRILVPTETEASLVSKLSKFRVVALEKLSHFMAI